MTDKDTHVMVVYTDCFLCLKRSLGYAKGCEDMNKIEILSGGREGKIYKESERVIRPANEWTPDVHSFLRYLYENNFKNIPIPCKITEDGKEVVSFVAGDVYNYPLPELLLRDETLVSVAKMLRRYHDVGEQYIQKLTGREKWMLPAVYPIEVMCHGDFAPYNVTILDGNVWGMIDFDTLHPGPRIWDVAYMKQQAQLGSEDFIRNIQDGHMDLYMQDMRYIIEHEKKFSLLCGGAVMV